MNTLKNIFRFDKIKGIVGAVLAVAILVICCIWFDWYMGIAFAAMFLLVGFVKIDVKKNLWKYLINFLWGVALICVTWICAEAMMNSIGYTYLGVGRVILNILCVCIICGIVFLVTASWRVSLVIGSLLLVVLATANGLTYQFRGKEIGPMDILSLRTAMSVANQYKAEITSSMAYGWAWWVLVVFLLFAIPKLPKLHRIWTRVITLGLVSVFFVILWIGSGNTPIKTWDKQGTEFNGLYLNFFIGIRDSIVEKPETYDPQDVVECAQNYIVADTAAEEKTLPNIIVIMDESYADVSVLGEDAHTNQPVTPFMDSLTENTIRGYALASVYGGNTANSEYEFLTGHSMSFLPTNSVPYQQYINGEIGTLAWLMESYGYKSIATHPYFANGWSRNRIYPYFGFEESTFVDTYSYDNLIRGYVSDKEVFDRVIQNLNDKEEGKPLFMFGITMQNHGGYTYKGDGYTQTIELEGYEEEFPKAEQYLTLIHETDSAMEYLLTELEKYPEDTVVLFFGDHFPELEGKFYEELHGKSFDTLPEKMLKYTVPFVIWANYDIPEQTVECTSLNYLSRYLLDAAGLELSPYHRFLADMEGVVPRMNAMGYYSVSKNEFIPYEEAEGEEAEWLDQYANIQYNNLFDSKNRSEVFFEQYIAQEQE